MSIAIIIPVLAYALIALLPYEIEFIASMIYNFGNSILLIINFSFTTLICIVIIHVKLSVLQRVFLGVCSLILIVGIGFGFNQAILRLSVAFASPETKNISSFVILIMLFLYSLVFLFLLSGIAFFAIREELMNCYKNKKINIHSGIFPIQTGFKKFFWLYTGGWIIDSISILFLLYILFYQKPNFSLLWSLIVISRLIYFVITTNKLKELQLFRLISLIAGFVILMIIIFIYALAMAY